MTKDQTPPLPPSRPASRVLKDEALGRAPNPQRRFRSPEMLVADNSLTDEQKHELLCEWELEVDNRLRAEEEGMSISDPIQDLREAKLADEAGRVRSCLASVAAKLGD